MERGPASTQALGGEQLQVVHNKIVTFELFVALLDGQMFVTGFLSDFAGLGV
jgi:hypothetical protein